MNSLGKIIIAFTGFLSARDIFSFQHIFWLIIAVLSFGYLVVFFLKKFNKATHPATSFVLQLLGIRSKKSFLGNALRTIFWSLLYLILGYLGGQTWHIIEGWIPRMGMVVALGSILLFGSYLLKKFIVEKGKQTVILCISVLRSIKEALQSNPDLQKITKKYPRFFQFVRQRLNPNTFRGLPLTLLSIAFLYVLFLFLGLVEDIITSDPIIEADVRIGNLLYAYRDPFLVKLFLWITVLGKWQVIVTGLLIFSSILFLWNRREYILPLWLTVVGSGIFDLIAKWIIHRPRPSGIAVYEENSFSFPSGHATIALAFYGFILYFLLRTVQNRKKKINSIFFGILLILVIGFSRLYLGVHFLSDILAGHLLGFLWLLIGISIVEWLHRRNARMVVAAPFDVRTYLLSLLLAGSFIVFYIFFTAQYNPPLSHIPQIEPQRTIQNIEQIIQAFSGTEALPKYSETVLAEPQEPLSFIIIASDDTTVVKYFQKAGWYLADPISGPSILTLGKSALLNGDYPTAPMTPSFWNGQVHDFGFQKPSPKNSVRQRHHARFWKTRLRWIDEKQIYVGTASFDKGLKWGLTHTIQPDIDTEREFLFNDISQIGVTASSATKIPFVEPIVNKNFLGDLFFTDGTVYILKF